MRFGAILLGTAVLAGCGEAVPDAQPTEATEVEVRSAKGTGTVSAIDIPAGAVTIEHGPMPEIGWPAMTMAFKADPALLAEVKEGDKVAFDLTLTGGRGEVTALTVE